MKKIGNLFFMAERQLIDEKKNGIIPFYTKLDIIEYAMVIRRFLDHNPKKTKQIMKLPREEIKRNNLECRRKYYARTGR